MSCPIHSQNTQEISTVLTITGLIPRFGQNPISYIELNELTDAYLTLDITICFKPTNGNGLILFKKGSVDFISLTLENAVPIFQFNLGTGTATLRAKNPIPLGQWCTIKIERDRRNATMTINKSQIIHGRIEGKLQGLDLTTPLFLGTVTNFCLYFASLLINRFNILKLLLHTCFLDIFFFSEEFTSIFCLNFSVKVFFFLVKECK